MAVALTKEMADNADARCGVRRAMQDDGHAMNQKEGNAG
jgi:hypothetical protein